MLPFLPLAAVPWQKEQSLTWQYPARRVVAQWQGSFAFSLSPSLVVCHILMAGSSKTRLGCLLEELNACLANADGAFSIPGVWVPCCKSTQIGSPFLSHYHKGSFSLLRNGWDQNQEKGVLVGDILFTW